MNRFARPIARLLVWGLIAVSATYAFQKQPRPKSQKEVDAINAMFRSTTADAQIAAAEALLTNFADTEFKSLALYIEADAYARKGQFEKSIVFGERALEADPKNFQAMLLLASPVRWTHQRERSGQGRKTEQGNQVCDGCHTGHRECR